MIWDAQETMGVYEKMTNLTQNEICFSFQEHLIHFGVLQFLILTFEEVKQLEMHLLEVIKALKLKKNDNENSGESYV